MHACRSTLEDPTEADPVLAKALDRANGAVWCERLAGLYVMVTRAKYANYIFLPPGPGEPGKSPSLAAITRFMLRQQDAGTLKIDGTVYPLVARFGKLDWYTDKVPAKPVAAAAKILPSPASGKATVQTDLFAEPDAESPVSRLRKTIPLRLKRPVENSEDGQPVFQTARLAAQETGLAVHAAFQRVVWLDGAESVLSRPGLEAEAVEEVRGCLTVPEVAALFEKPEGKAEVWRERAFDLVLDGVHESRVLDRVTVERDAAGRPVRAVLIDFKTGPVRRSAAEAAAAHRRQLGLYRLALSRLLGLPEEKIRAVVLFTATREVVDL